MSTHRSPASSSNHPDLPRLAYKLDEAAAMLGVSTVSLRRAIKDGRLRANRKLRHLLIPTSEILKFASLD